MTERPPLCATCHLVIDWAEQVDGGMVLCSACGAVTHSECADRHAPNCRPAQQRDRELLAAWTQGVREW